MKRLLFGVTMALLMAGVAFAQSTASPTAAGQAPAGQAPAGQATASQTTAGQAPANASPAASASHPHSIASRRENQQDRIANGVQSGQLTAGETRNLEGREASINRQTAADRAANGGKLTAQERQQIQQRQSRVSQSIYQDNHNAASQHDRGEVGARQRMQQQRIAQGIRSGQMTAGEAARAENRQAGINRQIHADRTANGGRLTAGQRAAINQRQNRASGQIYRMKHNAARQRP